jgi:CheY-like chemotaxis protein
VLEIGIDSITVDISEEAGEALKEGMLLKVIELVLPDEEISVFSGRVGPFLNNRCEVTIADMKRYELIKIKRYISRRVIEQSDLSAEKVSQAPATAEEELKGTKTILIIDDSPIFQDLYSKVFFECGYAVLQAKDGGEGIKIALSSFPDLILMDINMPVLSGIEATRVIKSHPSTKHIPVVMFTTEGEKSAVVRAIQVGAKDYLIKTMEKEAVIKRLQSFFEKKDSQS